MTPRLLDRELLEQLDVRLRDAGAMRTGAYRDGLTNDEIDAILAPLGIDLPEEARVWWRWQNGWRSVPEGHPAQLLPRRFPYSLQEAVELLDEVRDGQEQAGDPPALLAPFDERPVIWFRTDGPRSEPVPIYRQLDWSTEVDLVLPSLGVLVEHWIAYLDRGLFRTDGRGNWQHPQEHEYTREDIRLGVY